MKSVFTQTVAFRTDHIGQLIDLEREWDSVQASQDITGYMEVRVLADRDDPGRYIMIIDFGVVAPDLTAAQEAFLNNERQQTQEFSRRALALAKGEPEWNHYDELYRTSYGREDID
jgi:hypothetical protein